MNTTNIALIPHGFYQTSKKDSRLITLCNVLYNVTGKVLTNKLKGVVDKCISHYKSSFVSRQCYGSHRDSLLNSTPSRQMNETTFNVF